MKVIKNMVTILFVLVCGFVIFTFVGIYIAETKDMVFSLPYKVQLDFKEAYLDYIGDSYGIYQREDYSYYRLSVVMENEINVGVDEQLVYLRYRVEGTDRRITEVQQDGTDKILTDREYFPAGKQAVCFRILEIPDGCTGFDVVYYGIYEEEEQTIHITI